MRKGGEDLHLGEGADAIEAGPNLSTASVMDVDGQARPNGQTWDIGADEYQFIDNDPPVAADDEAATDEDSPTLITVLNNDSDADGDAITIIDVTDPAHGTAEIQGDSVAYTPADNFHGEDSFTYTISDGRGGQADARVTVTVNPVNDPPVANAGDDQDVIAGDTCSLDGSKSSDPDEGDTLT